MKSCSIEIHLKSIKNKFKSSLLHLLIIFQNGCHFKNVCRLPCKISFSLVTNICVIALFWGFSGQRSQFDFLKFKMGANFSNSKWLQFFFLKWPLFCKMAAIFQNGYPLTCKMEEFPFPSSQIFMYQHF